SVWATLHLRCLVTGGRQQGRSAGPPPNILSPLTGEGWGEGETTGVIQPRGQRKRPLGLRAGWSRPSAAFPTLVFRARSDLDASRAASRDQVRGVGGPDPASQLRAPPAYRSPMQLWASCGEYSTFLS